MPGMLVLLLPIVTS